MNVFGARLAGAPITWGVCEVPGWGLQLGVERVLTEMGAIGLRATESGPRGFLPADPRDLRETLARTQLRLVGGFLPLVLHEPARRRSALRLAGSTIDQLAAAGAEVLVVAAHTGKTGYEASGALDSAGWRQLGKTIAEVEDVAARSGMAVTLHPHHGTLVETPADVETFLAASSVALCLDTGHYLVGGGEPLALVKEAAARIAHVHLKDVARDLAEQVRNRHLSYREAVRRGMYRPLGEGTVDTAAVVAGLEANGYRGWYVLEQDTVLDHEPPIGGGPILAAAHSVEFLDSLSTVIGYS